MNGRKRRSPGIKKTPSRERYLLSLYERFLEWRRITYLNLWNKTTDLWIENCGGKDHVLTGIILEERRVLTCADSKSALFAQMETVVIEWTGCYTLEEADIFLSSLGF